MCFFNNCYSCFVVVVYSDNIIKLNDFVIEFLWYYVVVEIDDFVIDSFFYVNIGDGDINMVIKNVIVLFFWLVFGNFNYIEWCWKICFFC